MQGVAMPSVVELAKHFTIIFVITLIDAMYLFIGKNYNFAIF